MKPIKTRMCNDKLLRAKDWDESAYGDCSPLHVHHDPSLLLFYSWWKPTMMDTLRLLFGSTLRICIVSYRHPPIALDVDSEKEVSS
jgi:hypothetical protein